jgi:hypothetical protein
MKKKKGRSKSPVERIKRERMIKITNREIKKKTIKITYEKIKKRK